MKKKLNPKSIKPFQLLYGVVGLTALSIFNPVEPVKAVSLSCGPGNDWVSNCSSGIFDFSNSVTINVNFGFSPNNLPDFTAHLSGLTSIVISNPIDAIVDDPLLGNIGSLDGQQDVIQTENFSSLSSGSTPFVPLITARVGDGVPDLTTTPHDSTLPYKSLYSAGAIVQQGSNSALADSFFKLFIEIQGTPEGTVRTRSPVMLTSVPSLIGWPPGAEQNSVNFISSDITPLFTAGPDGLFWTGDEVEVARLVPGTDGSSVALNLTPVPEPSTVISSVLVGLGMIFGGRKKLLRTRKSSLNSPAQAD